MCFNAIRLKASGFSDILESFSISVFRVFTFFFPVNNNCARFYKKIISENNTVLVFTTFRTSSLRFGFRNIIALA